MGVSVLIDDCEGDPDALYRSVIDEVDRREIPRLEVGITNEYRRGRWVAPGERIPCLVITDSANNKFAHSSARVFAFQYGTSFYVSARHFWLLEDKRDFSFIEDVRSRCFMEVVDRAVRAGLERYFASRNIPLPAVLGVAPE